MTRARGSESRTLRRIAAVIEGREPPGFFLSPGLQALSLVYGALAGFRSRLYDLGLLKIRKLPCMVISVGNITAGGTGKTPVTVYIAGLLKAMGHDTVVISRGYGGRAQKTGGVVSDGAAIGMDAADCGDEPRMMAQLLPGVPVVVGADRRRAGLMAVNRFAPTVVVLDDGFQHRRLYRDLDIVLLDAPSLQPDMRLLPRGPLREPLSGLMRADALVLTRSSGVEGPAADILARLAPGKPIFHAFHAPHVREIRPARGGPSLIKGEGMGGLSGKRVFAFSGIAKNQAFFDMMAEYSGALAGSMAFPDHHPYSRDDIRSIAAAARIAGADLLVTTEKDAVKLTGEPALGFMLDLAIVGVTAVFYEDQPSFSDWLLAGLADIRLGSVQK